MSVRGKGVTRPLFLIVAGKNELPVAVGDSLTDLARQTGLSVPNLSQRFNRARRSGWKKGKVKQVWVEFTDEEWKRLKAGEEPHES